MERKRERERKRKGGKREDPCRSERGCSSNLFFGAVFGCKAQESTRNRSRALHEFQALPVGWNALLILFGDSTRIV